MYRFVSAHSLGIAPAARSQRGGKNLPAV